MADHSFVTLATNDSYVKGALVLGSSLRNTRTTKRLTALITPHVSDPMRQVLEKVFDEVKLVDVLDSGDSAHLALLKRPELGVTLTKIHCWELTHYSKCVFMDADTMVLSNIDELFEREELSAAPDPGWPDCFNSGVFVFRPSIETFNQLLQLATEKGSFDGGDQGLLNTFFSSWATTDISKHLPFIYNLSSISIYSYLPAFKATNVAGFWGNSKRFLDTFGWKVLRNLSKSGSQIILLIQPKVPLDSDFVLKSKEGFLEGLYSKINSEGIVGNLLVTVTQFGTNAKVVHFLGRMKPWNYSYDFKAKSVKDDAHDPTMVHPEFLDMWWDTFITNILPLLQQHGAIKDTATGVKAEEVAEAVSHLSLSSAALTSSPPSPPAMSSEERKERWEQGQADYMGADSFDNIQKKLDTYLQ